MKTVAASAESAEFVNQFQDIFDRQKAYFQTDVTKTYEWRIDQLNRFGKMLRENQKAFYEALRKDFKIALFDQVFEVEGTLAILENAKAKLKEWMRPQEVKLSKTLTEQGHRGLVYREPYGVTLVIGPFNGPLLLLLDPAIAVLSAGNPCILTTASATPAASSLLQELVQQYFVPEAVTAVGGGKIANTELLKLPFEFIFFTGSTNVGKVVMRALRR